MPTYGYKCTKCAHKFEIFQKMSDDALKECPSCRGELRKILYPVGIAFKGTGFHINDYKKPEKSGVSSSLSTSSDSTPTTTIPAAPSEPKKTEVAT